MKTLAIGLTLALAACEPPVSFRSKSLEKVNPRVLADKEYPAARFGIGSVTYRPLFGLVSEDLTLKEKPLLTQDIRQASRPLNFESYVQGYDGSMTTQEFEISSAGKLDLLLVIDNSGSMGEEQAELSTNLSSLLKSLETVDWQIGIITTDNCRLQNTVTAGKPLRKGVPNITTTFESTIKGLGTGGSRDEQGIKTALQQISGRCVGSPNSWLRSDASLAVFFVSDEQNECFGDPNCADDLGVKWGPTELITQMKSMRSSEQLKAYALLWNKDIVTKPSRNPQCRRDSGVETHGSMYSQVVEAIGGLERSICLDTNTSTNDYGPLLEQISSDVNRSIQREFNLNFDPVADSIGIEIDGVPAQDVQINGRKIILRNASNTQIKLRVTYRYDAIPKFDRVKLRDVPALDTLQVKINNRPINQDRLQYDESKSELIFLDMPGDREKVTMQYRVREELPTRFDVSRIVEINGPVQMISVEGKQVNNWRPEDNGRFVVLEKAPPDASLVTLHYKQKDPKILEYRLSSHLQLEAVQEITAKDKFTGELIPFNLSHPNLRFDQNDVEEGRQVVITYDYGRDSSRLAYDLPQEPIPESVEIHSEKSTEECIQNVRIIGKEVLFDCTESTIDDITLNYRFIEERFYSFKIPLSFDKSDILQVYVDGFAFKNYTVKDQIVTIPTNELTPESKVRIMVLESTGKI